MSSHGNAFLFSYGTLQQDTVQLSTFGRRLDGHRDVLHGFTAARGPVKNAPEGSGGLAYHANARFTGRPSDSVAGMAFEVTAAELEAADVYEQQADYGRILVTLASGTRAWVYVHAGSALPND